jgi:peptidoglycan/xylan/chitin deacetylase (PgdA/CDA1 family)
LPLAIGLVAGCLTAAIGPALPAALLAATGAAIAASTLAGRASDRRRTWAGYIPAVAVLAVLALVGATNPAAPWLGPVISHGPRDRAQVALTFDDGPNAETTRQVLDSLNERGVKATFFVVGKAVDGDPETVQRIIASGHLLGNHSYNHDGWRFIQPGYPELARAERSIKAATHVCTRFYRPPHGTHTPFAWFAAQRRSMQVVTWDVSTLDWSAVDAGELARSVVARARPGSIILLHDGIDGVPGADRRVLLDALPAILDGLRARGLDPVRLDALLGRSGERPC